MGGCMKVVGGGTTGGDSLDALVDDGVAPADGNGGSEAMATLRMSAIASFWAEMLRIARSGGEGDR